MKKYKGWLYALAIFGLLYYTCSDSSSSSNKSSVNWSNYDSSLKNKIDTTNDCGVLQTEFNNAQSNSERQRSRVGEGNASLMEYIDKRMKKVGCY